MLKIFYKPYLYYNLIVRNKILKKRDTYSQFQEDIFLQKYFKDINDGFYVDIGCYHPIKGSLTYQLYKKGWKGLNVDLSKVSIDLFKLARSKDYNIHAAVADFDGETHFYENGIINQQNSLENKGGSLKKIKIKAYKLQTLLEASLYPSFS